MKDGTENLLKFKMLERDLGLAEWQVIGLLEAIWKFVKKNCPRGDIGRFTNEEIAIGIKYDGDADKLIGTLTARGWLDACECEARLIVHDWPDHAEDTVHKSLARRRQWFADGTAPSLSRLSGDERKQCEKFYGENTCAKSARRASVVRTTSTPKTPLPEPSLAIALAKTEPSQTPPTPRRRTKAFTLDEVPFPPSLDTPEARQAAAEWLEHKRSRGEAYASPKSFAKKLQEWARAGPAEFAAAVISSIGNNYAGIFPPKDSQNGHRANNTGAGQRYLPGRDLGPV